MMRRSTGSLLLLCSFWAAPAQGQQAEGHWQAVLGNAGRLALEIRRDPAGTYEGTIEAVDQSPERRPVTDLRVTGDRLSFRLPAFDGHFEGRWDPSVAGWSGRWSQRGGQGALVFTPGSPGPRPVVAGLDGSWHGALPIGDASLRLVLHVRTGPRGTLAKLDSPDQLAAGLPVDSVERDEDEVRLGMSALGASFSGRLAADGSRIDGRWTQNGNSAPLSLTRRDAAAQSPRRRPQMPARPYPYREIDAVYDNPAAPSVRLAGTLTLPSGPGPFPAALLISGSGGQDRDGTLFGHKPFLVLADHLTRHGIAVLRFDDRGVGTSTGERAGATSKDFATDVAAGLAWLRTRPEIDIRSLGLIGASEGGMIAPMVAGADPALAFVVLLAGPGERGDRLWVAQQQAVARSLGAGKSDIDRQGAVNRALVDAARSAADAKAAETRIRAVLEALPEDDRPARQAAEQLLERLTSPWMRWFLNYDPAPALARVRAPILALNGTKDVQVDAALNLSAIRRAAAGNPDLTVLEMPGLNHLFQTARTGAVGEYGEIEETFAPVALKTVSAWILARVGRPRDGEAALRSVR